MKRFKKFRDDRFALTTLQNPLCEASPAELVQAAEQERQRHAQPAAIPATPSSAAPNPPAAPDAPAAANPSPAPDPHAAAPAPPNSQNETAPLPPKPQQYVTVVKLKPGLSSKDVQTARQQNSKSRRKSNSLSRDEQLVKAAFSVNDFMTRADKLGVLHDDEPVHRYDPPEESLSEQQLAQLSPIERHSRKCSICHHPQRQEIEEDFVHWRRPATIMRLYAIKKRTTIYGHALALGLLDVRARNLRSALGNIIEKGDDREPTSKEVVLAVRAYANINAQGEWVPPIIRTENRSEIRTEVVVSGKPSRDFSNAADILIGTGKLLENDANH